MVWASSRFCGNEGVSNVKVIEIIKNRENDQNATQKLRNDQNAIGQI